MIRRLLQDLRARLDRRTRRWILERQGRDTDPVELRRNRVYILPTSLGLAYWSLNQRDAAIAEWREVLRRDPTDKFAGDMLARAIGGGR